MEQRFIDWLHEELRNRGWKSADLARASGMAPSTISRILSGQTTPSDKGYSKIAKALGEPREKVFRLVGLLPPLPSSGDGPILKEIIDVVKRMPEDEKQQVLNYARMRYKNQQDKDKGKPPKTVTLTVPAVKPAIERIAMEVAGKQVDPALRKRLVAALEKLTPEQRAAELRYLLQRAQFIEAQKQSEAEQAQAENQ